VIFPLFIINGAYVFTHPQSLLPYTIGGVFLGASHIKAPIVIVKIHFSFFPIFFFHKTLKNEIHMRNKSCKAAKNKAFEGKKDICEDMRRQF